MIDRVHGLLAFDVERGVERTWKQTLYGVGLRARNAGVHL